MPLRFLGRDEDLLWELADQLEPEDGMLWVYDIDGVEIPAFTADGIEARSRRLIPGRVNRSPQHMLMLMLTNIAPPLDLLIHY